MSKQGFLPVSREDMVSLNIKQLDFVYVCGGEASQYPNEDIQRLAKTKVNAWLETH